MEEMGKFRKQLATEVIHVPIKIKNKGLCKAQALEHTFYITGELSLSHITSIDLNAGFVSLGLPSLRGAMFTLNVLLVNIGYLYSTSV